MNDNISSFTAFIAMKIFIDDYYQKYPSDNLAILLSNLFTAEGKEPKEVLFS